MAKLLTVGLMLGGIGFAAHCATAGPCCLTDMADARALGGTGDRVASPGSADAGPGSRPGPCPCSRRGTNGSVQ